jgi:hypothetical protein
MINLLTPIFTFLFIFSSFWLSRTAFLFLGALLSTPPKTFELTKNEVFYHGILLSYVITFIIHN